MMVSIIASRNERYVPCLKKPTSQSIGSPMKFPLGGCLPCLPSKDVPFTDL